MDAKLRESILEYQDYLGFELRKSSVPLEANEPHDERISRALCDRFYGREKELKGAINDGNWILRELLSGYDKTKDEKYLKYLELFYELVGNMYYLLGDFRLSTGYFMKVLSHNKRDITPWVELLFSLRAMGEFELFEAGMFDFSGLYLRWQKSSDTEMSQDVLYELITGKKRVAKARHVLGKIEITTKCNQECLFCPVDHTEKELGFEEIKRKIEELKEKGTTEIMFSGGEPTLRTDLPELVGLAFKLGFKEVCIQTNGSNLHDLKVLKSYLQAGPVKFDISYHSHKKEIFEQISGQDGSFENFLKGMENIRKLDVPAYFTVVIHSLNYKMLKEQIEFSERYFPNIRHFSFNYIDAIGRTLNNKWIVPRLSEAEPYMREAFGHILSKGMSFRIEFVPLCFISGFEEFSSESRRERYNEPAMFSLLNINKGDIIVRSNKYYMSPVCEQCALKEKCPGLHNNYIQIHGIGELKPVLGDEDRGHYIVNINHRCNFNCVFCADSPEMRKKEDFEYEYLIKELEKNRKRTDSIIISGGEPTIYPKILDYIRYAKKIGFAYVTLTTNGFLLSNKEMLERFISAGVDAFNVSFLAAEEKLYDEISGVPGSFNQVVKGIGNIQERKKKLDINVVIHGKNYKELDKIVSLSVKLGVNSIQLSFMNPIGTSVKDGKSSVGVRYGDVVPYVTDAFKKADELGFRKLGISNFPICVVPELKERISDLGHHRSNKEYYSQLKMQVEKCQKCDYANICEGVWKAYVEQEGEGEIHPVMKGGSDKHAIMEIENKCNQFCVFCSVDKDKMKSIRLEEIEQQIAKLTKEGVSTLTLSGGEPTLNRDLSKILGVAKEKGIKKIIVQTNGILLSDENYLKKITDSFSEIEFLVSFHSSDPEIYEKITGVKKNYELALKALRNISNSNGSTLAIGIVINSLNYTRLKEDVEFLHSNFPDIAYYNYIFIDPINEAKKNSWTVASMSSVEPYLYDALCYIKSKGIRAVVDRLPLCYLKGFEEYSANTKQIIGQSDVVYSLLYKDGFESSGYRHKYPGECNSCDLKSICGGLSENYIELLGSKELKPVKVDVTKMINVLRDKYGEIKQVIFDKVKTKDGEDSHYYGELATKYYEQGNLPKAIEYSRKNLGITIIGHNNWQISDNICKSIIPPIYDTIHLHEMEWIGLEKGIKPCSIFYVKTSEINNFKELVKSKGYCYVESDYSHRIDSSNHISITDNTTQSSKDYKPIFVSKSQELAEKLFRLDNDEKTRNKIEACIEIGNLLGYPSCCVQFNYDKQKIQSEYSSIYDPETYMRVMSCTNTKGEYSYLLNNIHSSTPAFIAHFPCSYNCEKSIQFASVIESGFREKDKVRLERIKRFFRLPVLFFSYFREISFVRNMLCANFEYTHIIYRTDSELADSLQKLFDLDVVEKFRKGNRLIIEEDKISIMFNDNILYEVISQKPSGFRFICFE